MRNEDHYSESTELPNSAAGEAGNDTQDRIIGKTFQGVGGPGPA